MFKSKGLFCHILLLCSSYLCVSALSEKELNNLCKNKSGQKVAHPSDNTKYIACLSQPVEAECRQKVDSITGDPIRVCFDNSAQACTENCPTSGPSVDGSDEYKAYINIQCKKSNFGTKLSGMDCEHYYECLDSESEPSYIEQSCPTGQHYSRSMQKCLAQYEAGCETLCANRNDDYKYAAAKCYQYYECKNQKASLNTCSYGEYFDTKSLKCSSDSSAKKCADNAERQPECAVSNNGNFYPHQECNKYYVCMNKIAYEGQCAPEYYYDAHYATCVRGSCK